MLRTANGWRIECIILFSAWSDGDENLIARAVARNAAEAGTGS
ncbi:hypothetical protein [Yinghuangia sp. YIM S09857]